MIRWSEWKNDDIRVNDYIIISKNNWNLYDGSDKLW